MGEGHSNLIEKGLSACHDAAETSTLHIFFSCNKFIPTLAKYTNIPLGHVVKPDLVVYCGALLMLQSSAVTKEGEGRSRGHIPHSKTFSAWTDCSVPNDKILYIPDEHWRTVSGAETTVTGLIFSGDEGKSNRFSLFLHFYLTLYCTFLFPQNVAAL